MLEVARSWMRLAEQNEPIGRVLTSEPQRKISRLPKPCSKAGTVIDTLIIGIRRRIRQSDGRGVGELWKKREMKRKGKRDPHATLFEEVSETKRRTPGVVRGGVPGVRLSPRVTLREFCLFVAPM
jgi:hypothetical protein